MSGKLVPTIELKQYGNHIEAIFRDGESPGCEKFRGDVGELKAILQDRIHRLHISRENLSDSDNQILKNILGEDYNLSSESK